MSEAIVLTCKICGWDFPLRDGELIACCPGCGTEQSRPRVSQDAMVDLHRAHKQRCACDFTNAANSYQHVLRVHPDSAEALWGLALCKYGVEYVQDEKSGERLPVVHFLNRRPITEDPDYLLAYAHAAPEDRPGYQHDAAYISRIQQDVLAAEGRGDAWDVFLCYKSSVPGAPDEHTREFAHAQELYIALRDAGYSVFFAHTTLRRAAGANYEAQVFHALQSARAMLVVVSDPAHLNTPWVHSEWSRYLERIDAGEPCRLIPLLYDGCNPYSLPDAFLRRSIQGLMMGSLTSLDDLRRILAQQVHRAAAAPAVPTNNRALLRISMALEDGDWQKAESLAAALIDEVPDCAEAHLSLMLARRKEATLDVLTADDTAFAEEVCWKRALRFAGAELRRQMTECVERIEAAKRAAEEEARRKAEEAARKAAWEKEYREWRYTVWSAFISRNFSVSCSHTVGLQADGTVMATGYNGTHQCDVSHWKDIVSIAAGHYHTVGLTSDNKVLAIGDNQEGQCDTSQFRRRVWEGYTYYNIKIKDISAGALHSVCLYGDGRVDAIGMNTYSQCDTSDWNNIVKIATGAYHTIGLHIDHSVVAVGRNDEGQCNVSDWKDIISVSASEFTTVGLHTDGTVIATGDNTYGQCDVFSWTEIVDVAAGDYHTVGLRTDGTVVAIGENQYGECNVSTWTDVVAVAAGNGQTVGLLADGSVVATGYSNDGQCDVSSWRLKQIPRPPLPPVL